MQKSTIFAAGLSSTAASAQAGAALIAFLCAPEAAPVIRKTGLDPVAHPAGE